MARRKARIPQGKKIQPAVKTMIFSIPGIEGANTQHFIDISQCASIVNRRFYRQGLAWHVTGFTLVNKPNVSGSFTVSQIPETWVASNAWEKGFRAWTKMNNEALEESESVKPKFLDFKVFMSSTHHEAGSSANLLPEDTIGNVFTPGEWEYSKYHIPNTAVDSSDPTSNNPRDIIWTGANYQGVGASGDFAVSLIEGYAASRGLPDIQDPNTPDDASSVNASLAQNWLAALDNDFDQQTGEVLTDMITENNQAPYPFENDGVHTDTMYPGGANQAPGLQNVCSTNVTATTVGGTTYLPGSMIPGGLLHITNNLQITGDQTTSPAFLLLHLAPGFHRGYDATPLQEM